MPNARKTTGFFIKKNTQKEEEGAMKKVAKKLLSLVVVVCIAFMGVFTVPTFGAKAATTEVVFTMGSDGAAEHKETTAAITSYSETADGYTLALKSCNKVYEDCIDAKGNGCIKLGTSKVVGSFSFTVPDDVTSVVIAVAQYKANTTKIKVNDVNYTIMTASNNGAYTDVEVDTTTTKTVNFTTVSGGVRAMINTITYVIEDSATPTPKVLVKGEAAMFIGNTQTLEAEVLNTTGTPAWTSGNTDVAEVVASEDGLTAVVTAKAMGTATITATVGETTGSIEIAVWPSNEETLTIAEAVALANTRAHNTYTDPQYYVEGTISDLYNTTYGNFHLVDAEGNDLTIYGLYSADGKTRYDSMTVKPVEGDFVRVYGVLGTFNSSPQMKNAWLIEHVVPTDYQAEVDEVNAYTSLAYTYTQNGETFETSDFRIRFGVDAALTTIEGAPEYGIQVTVGDTVVKYTTTNVSWTVENGYAYVVVDLGDIINNMDKLNTVFTVAAYIVVDGTTYVSTATKPHSVATMVAEYYANEETKAAVEHLYNYLNA